MVTAAVTMGTTFLDDQPGELQFVVTSDAHYGLTRTTFRGHADVDAQIVNQALVAKLNRLADVRFPLDGGLSEDRPIGGIDFVVEAGDITNREEHTDELTVQPASASWAEFVADYVDGLQLRDHSGAATPVFVVAGN